MGMHDCILPFQQRLLDQIDMSLEEIEGGGNSQGILLIGASGTGKSHALELVVNRYGAVRMEGYQRINACCRVAAATKADAATTATSVLAQLGKPNAAKSSLDALERSMMAALRAHKVRLLIFEEFHNALLSGAPLLRGQTARLLKNTWNQNPLESADGWAIPNQQRGDYRLAIIVSGTDELREPFKKDKELASRFGCVIETDQLAFKPAESFRDFRRVLRSLAERFNLASRLDANNDDLAARFLAACQAHLRILEKLLQRIATLSRRHPGQEITMDLLANAYDQVAEKAHPRGNPFRWTADEVASYVTREQARSQSKSFTKRSLSEAN